MSSGEEKYDALLVLTDFLYEMWVYQFPKAVVTMLIMWIWFLATKIECIVDFAWTVNHLVIGASLVIQYYKQINYRAYVGLALLTLWFLRLGGYLLFDRICKGYTDKRYEKLAENFKNKNLYFLLQYQFQALLVVGTATPLYFVFRDYTEEDGEVRWNMIAMIVIVIIGLIGEDIADRQLSNYKKRKSEMRKKMKEQGQTQKNQVGGEVNVVAQQPQGNKNAGSEYQVLLTSPDSDDEFPNIFREGLWRKSRHPNLFFELIVWIGFAVGGLNDFKMSWLGFLGPIFLFVLMKYVTVPITEEHMKSTRPNWDKFCQKSNMFWIF